MLRLRVVVWFACFSAGCGGAQRAYRAAEPETATPIVQPAQPARQPSTEHQHGVVYALDEAVADVLSGPLQHIGTGPWQGIQRLHACAYRNDRVIVVNVYCTIKEATAVRIEVYSPVRGHARLYAEASSPVSQLERREYFSFKGEVQAPPPPQLWLKPVTLTMSLQELQAYERQRYESFLPACYGGIEVHRPQGGCLGDLAPHAAAWARRNQSFLDQPPQDWHRLLAQLRALALEHGRDR